MGVGSVMGGMHGMDETGGVNGWMGWKRWLDGRDRRSSLKEVGHADGVNEISGINWLAVGMGCWVGSMACIR